MGIRNFRFVWRIRKYAKKLNKFIEIMLNASYVMGYNVERNTLLTYIVEPVPVFWKAQNWKGMGTKMKFGINGSTLKIIAIITMLIDHIGAVILNNLLHFSNGELIKDSIFIWYQICRSIGRISFPIFCFLLVEGFLHTHDVKKYAIRLLIFAFISEIPFDLAVNYTVYNIESQNVFFTLFIGILVLIGFRAIEQKEGFVFLKVGYIIILLLGIALSIVLATDYSMFGIISIAVLYLYRSRTKYQIMMGACSFLWEPFALLGFIPIAFYNHERGLNLKYFFYLFYPIHLLLLYFIAINIQ